MSILHPGLAYRDLERSESARMDGLTELLSKLHKAGHFAKHLRGVFHVLIGRRITLLDGTVVSVGITWRELANLLKDQKIEPEVVSQLGVDPEDLSPRERPRFWYSAIALAKPDGPVARAEAEYVIAMMKQMGYLVGTAPAPSTTLSTTIDSPSNKKPTSGKPEQGTQPPSSRKKKPR